MNRGLRWLWPAVIAVAWIVLAVRGVDPRAALAGPASALQDSPWFAVGLLGAFLARAVVLLPSTLLTVLAGFALGPVVGGVVALLGATGSGLLAYGLARGVAPASRVAGVARRRGRLAVWRERLRRDAFRSTLIARLALVPGDLVNIAAGTARVPWRPFALATLIGGAPGLFAAVLAGASLQGAFDPEAVRIGWGPLAGSFALALLTFVASGWARRRAPDAAARQGEDGGGDENGGGGEDGGGDEDGRPEGADARTPSDPRR